jgi:hypothetical protein
VARLLGLVATLLAIAMIAIGAGAMTEGSSRARFDDRGPATTAAFEPTSDRGSSQNPVSAPDPGDDDDDNDDDQEVAIQPSLVVAHRSFVSTSPVSENETIRPSLGHPPGIDDPPRS